MERRFGNFKQELPPTRNLQGLSKLHEAIAKQIHYYNTTQKQTLTPVTQLYVRDRDGGYYPLRASSYTFKNPLQATVLLPGQVVTGQIAFAIPKNTALPLLYIDFGWNDLAPSVISVQQ